MRGLAVAHDQDTLRHAVARRRDRFAQPCQHALENVRPGRPELERGRFLADADGRTGTLADANGRDHCVKRGRAQTGVRIRMLAGAVATLARGLGERPEKRRATVAVVQLGTVAAHANAKSRHQHRTTIVRVPPRGVGTPPNVRPEHNVR